jgi:peroxiredoxin
MPALKAGKKAPDFSLPAMDGKKFSLQEGLTRGPVVLAFFKVSCPISQYAFPLYERLYQAYKNQGVTLVGVSQNERADTETFCRKFGVTFPTLLEDTSTFPVSNAYGLTSVPTLFWISPDGTVEIASVGWDRKDYEKAGRQMAGAARVPAAALIPPGEQVADFRAG